MVKYDSSPYTKRPILSTRESLTQKPDSDVALPGNMTTQQVVDGSMLLYLVIILGAIAL